MTDKELRTVLETIEDKEQDEIVSTQSVSEQIEHLRKLGYADSDIWVLIGE